MMVRNMLGGTALSALLCLGAATAASAQYTVTTTVPPPPVTATGPGTAIFTGGTAPASNLVDTSSDTNVLVPLGSGVLTPFFNYNQTGGAGGRGSNTTFSGATQLLTVIASKNGAAATNGAQSLTITINGSTTAGSAGPPPTNGNVTLSGSPAFSFSVPQLFFTFADGSSLTLSNFGASNATGVAFSGTGADGIFGFQAAVEVPTAAPEPGSLALAATGMLGMIGMVSVRRFRRAA